MKTLTLIEPDWPAPASVQSIVTTRIEGVSAAPYDSLNLALHVDDSAEAVQENRAILSANFTDVQHWHWLEQIHSAEVLTASSANSLRVGDGLVVDAKGLACCILTADCLPMLICNQSGNEVAALHGGWRGLAAGIIANALAAMRSSPDSLLVWLGPAIGPCHFEVGADVREQFLQRDPSAAMDAQFIPNAEGKYQADLYGIARTQLQQHGVESIYGGGFCTYCDESRFYSYRRDGRCGRTLSAIYLT